MDINREEPKPSNQGMTLGVSVITCNLFQNTHVAKQIQYKRLHRVTDLVKIENGREKYQDVYFMWLKHYMDLLRSVKAVANLTCS